MAKRIDGTGAQQLLQQAQNTLMERGHIYGADEERNMSNIVLAFNAATGLSLTTTQGWLFMVALKLVRSGRTPLAVKDHFVDGANYFALAGEEALK